ncbi:MAG: hypothetical protein JJ959_07355 [Nisaea sp.]|uniref:DUF6614 family protein n=1 Tax=Nisaea sp. TaxID=2024842 RepID=UPI001B1E1FA1|nr:DUF6614 family protein [Nisaea sp.]MBO6560337.1 hypothetical protein [Nisaea sp.]
MDFYHIYCDLKPEVKDIEFADSVQSYFAYLKDQGLIEDSRITRRKLGLGPADGTEFHMWLETRDLAQLDAAFAHVSSRSEPVESFHHAVNSKVQNVRFTLYRDFPDAQRERGQEKF